MADTCKTCGAWLADRDAGDVGLCRAHPPAPMFGSYSGQPGSGVPKAESYFPTTKYDDWCRELAAAVTAGDSP